MDAGVEPGDARGLVGLLTNGVWLLGLVAQGVGVALQAAALDRGRVAIIQPLLVTSIVWALPLGYLLTNQTITRRHIAGAAIIVVGLAVFATVGDPAAGIDDAPTSTWISALARRRRGLHRADDRSAAAAAWRRRPPSSATTAGVLYGVAATLMKPVVEAWHVDGLGQLLAGWQLWVMAAAGLVGFCLQQVSLATGKLVDVRGDGVGRQPRRQRPARRPRPPGAPGHGRRSGTPSWRSAPSRWRCSAPSSSPRRPSPSRHTVRLAVS